MNPSDAKPQLSPLDDSRSAMTPPELGQAIQRAISAYQRGDVAEAERLCRTVLDAEADHFHALHLLGVVAARTGRAHEAVDLLSRAVSANPASADAWISHGNALRELKRDPEALACYERAIALRPDHAGAHNNRGNVLRRLERHIEALQSFERALALKPDYVEAHSNRGNALADLKRHAEALASYERAIALKPDYADAWSNRGNLLRDLKRYPEALASYGRALASKPDHVDALYNRGVALSELKQWVEALESYAQALRLEPDFPFLYGIWLRARMQICDWNDFPVHADRLTERIERSEAASSPFPVLALSSDPAVQRRAAEIWVRERYAAIPASRDIGKGARRDRIRIGYFSADFRQHPVSALTAELFERHDKSRFELIAFSYGPESNDEMRARLVAAFDQFLDVRAQTDEGIVRLSADLGVDIAVDLGGYTGDSRPGIFARRAAPVQASYLGYPGTMGADFIDYLFADRTIVPEEHRRHYSEKIVYLPSYQASDSTRRIADRTFTREELGLPSKGVVFCCFNNNYKVTPRIFDRWMEILRRVEGSVLFLYAENEWVAPNLGKEASARGVDPRRLVFAARLPMAEYLARYRVADLFLDTSPYNAGATASDALWSGVPVLTCLGETFAGRMGASLLTAIGLPELIATTLDQYESMAVDIATNPCMLAGIKQKLAHQRVSAPLFDMGGFARCLEAAYVEIYERWQAGLPAAQIDVRA